MATSACLRFTRKVWRSFLETKGHDKQCFPNLVIHDATPGTVHASLEVQPSNLNRVGTGRVPRQHGMQPENL
ncbi:putative thioesterase thiol ester dehydrase-isomerase [Lyophyllum shimeji]|uniref:Thioesterase thiol ester dehydrase-isomerase n=1 Tax=Lyophyllum shimeji TaxID=47721 RepID=A0A9P3PMS1_LYOSH|nr:putative thioesterase thiol ester dehydrase-isomerase [Lyophyllum shimeji]